MNVEWMRDLIYRVLVFDFPLFGITQFHQLINVPVLELPVVYRELPQSQFIVIGRQWTGRWSGVGTGTVNDWWAIRLGRCNVGQETRHGRVIALYCYLATRISAREFHRGSSTRHIDEEYRAEPGILQHVAARRRRRLNEHVNAVGRRKLERWVGILIVAVVFPGELNTVLSGLPIINSQSS